ncbi:hypothetical protein WICPIJ_006374 [Wickerhamomyces pijperi]|uniref:Vacuolar protein sorting-associated protein 62 n=1 Tax=Wickerhamomyces pijperi TaxID=599730 RepID=A0A9P8Q445_WICPI|nr:hypothetical protein WICPIJ_006374 [Wickerhamomyces pijperi]
MQRFTPRTKLLGTITVFLSLLILIYYLIISTSSTALNHSESDDLNLNFDYFKKFDVEDNELIEYLEGKGLDEGELPPLSSLPLQNHEKTLNPGEVPSYVFEYTPLVYLYTEETYLPYDISKYISHFVLKDEFNNTVTEDFTIDKMAQFTGKNSSKLLLTTLEDTNDPEWLTGESNIPNLSTGKIKDAPAVLVVVDKGNGWVDAYWFYFYSFNLGPFVMGVGPYGNHFGDWEHSLTRFYKGVPVYVWMSAHGGGNAYHYEAMEKFDRGYKRPLIFSSRGTHANYALIGRHSHDLPWGMLSDFTDKGSLWDPAENYLGYTWDGHNLSIIDSESKGQVNYTEQKIDPNWLLFKGKWGNAQLPTWDPRQQWSIFEWKYITGPTGPLTKNLSRLRLCQTKKWFNFFGDPCPPKKFLKGVNKKTGKAEEGAGVCGDLFAWVRPVQLRYLIQLFIWKGWVCTLMDWVLG